jgi:hypothetical protein
MTPFEEFKIWFRQGAAWERGTAAIAAVIVLALAAWVLVPADADDTSGGGGDAVAVAAGGDAAVTPTGAGATTTTPAGGAAPAPVVGSAATPAAGAAAGSTAAGATGSQPVAGAGAPAAATSNCPSGSTDQGVTATTLLVAVVVLDVAGGNGILGVPPASEQRRQNEAMINYYNSKGGIRCRKLVAKYYTDNPLDANSEHSICLDIVASKVFASIGGLYQPQNSTCLAQNKIPSYTQTTRPTSEMKRFAPYVFSFYADSETNFNIYVAGTKEQGFFNGMTKMGVLTGQCFPEYNDQLFAALGRAGIGKDKIVTFDYGCPPGGIVQSPSTVAQAVLKFQQAGVNRVMTAGQNLGQFTRQAASQGFRPQYSSTDVDTTLQLTNGTGFAPDKGNFDGAINIANNQYGALNSPGTPISAFTNECNAALTKGGAQKATDEIGYAGGTCNQWNMFSLGATKAKSLQRAQLAAGLNSVGRFEQSYPGAPALWNNPAKTWAGPFWRPVRYAGACNCWKVIRANFSDAGV